MIVYNNTVYTNKQTPSSDEPKKEIGAAIRNALNSLSEFFLCKKEAKDQTLERHFEYKDEPTVENESTLDEDELRFEDIYPDPSEAKPSQKEFKEAKQPSHKEVKLNFADIYPDKTDFIINPFSKGNKSIKSPSCSLWSRGLLHGCFG